MMNHWWIRGMWGLAVLLATTGVATWAACGGTEGPADDAGKAPAPHRAEAWRPPEPPARSDYLAWPEVAEAAERAYMERAGRVLGAHMKALDCGRFRIGYGIPDFAEQGDVLWEVRLVDAVGYRGFAVEAVLWLQPDSGKAYAVSGPWSARPAAAADVQQQKESAKDASDGPA